MKLFTTIITAIALSSGAHAQEPKQVVDRCELQGVLATLAMALRQDSIPIVDARLLGQSARQMTPDEVKAYDDILVRAYATPIQGTASGRESVTSDFAKEVALRCRQGQ